jgi:hypothetical protein
MNKKQGRNISKMLRNKEKGASKVNIPIDIEDQGLNSTQNTYTQKYQSPPPIENTVEENSKIDSSLEASFWKSKYYDIVPILDSNMVDLELENDKIISHNTLMKSYYEKKLAELECEADKKENVAFINSQGVNIFINSKFTNYAS